MPPFKQDRPAAEVAEVLAIQALGFIAQDPERLGRFLAITGIGPSDIRQSARDRAFLVGVLDYVTSDEGLLVAFAGHAGIDPMTVVTAQNALAEACDGKEGD
jgi:hypothetical protein